MKTHQTRVLFPRCREVRASRDDDSFSPMGRTALPTQVSSREVHRAGSCAASRATRKKRWDNNAKENTRERAGMRSHTCTRRERCSKRFSGVALLECFCVAFSKKRREEERVRAEKKTRRRGPRSSVKRRRDADQKTPKSAKIARTSGCSVCTVD